MKIQDMQKQTIIEKKDKEKIGNIAICTGGTADIPVAEEAAQTAEFFGNNVERIYDVGVAGIHRVLSQREKLEKANCIIYRLAQYNLLKFQFCCKLNYLIK